MTTIVGCLLGILCGAVIGGLAVCKIAARRVREARDLSDKLNKLYLLMNEWVKEEQLGGSIAAYFSEHGYRRVVIYGMNHVGQRLLWELKRNGIEVVCGIDQNADKINADIKIIQSTEIETMGAVDVIVVTAVAHFDEIYLCLKTKVKCPVVSLEDIVYR